MENRKIFQRPQNAPNRPLDSHKGTFGTVIVVGGSPTMPGAPALTARAALRAGVGLVKIAASQHTLDLALCLESSATGIVLPSSAKDLRQALDAVDPDAKAVLAVGPGMGTSDSAGRTVEEILRGPRAVVLDADGLNLLARSPHRRAAGGPPLVLTPHPGEFRRLAQRLDLHHDPTDADQRPQAAAALAQLNHAVVLLKGQRTVVTDGHAFYLNETGNPALATAGSGDVLTGLLASLMAQGMSAMEAASLAAHTHGRAADLWAKDHGTRGLLARELADMIPRALSS